MWKAEFFKGELTKRILFAEALPKHSASVVSVADSVEPQILGRSWDERASAYLSAPSFGYGMSFAIISKKDSMRNHTGLVPNKQEMWSP